MFILWVVRSKNFQNMNSSFHRTFFFFNFPRLKFWWPAEWCCQHLGFRGHFRSTTHDIRILEPTYIRLLAKTVLNEAMHIATDGDIIGSALIHFSGNSILAKPQLTHQYWCFPIGLSKFWKHTKRSTEGQYELQEDDVKKHL